MKKVLHLSIFIIAFLSMSACIREDATPVEIPPMDGVLSLDVGGAAFPNQVWVDLSEGSQVITKRHAWDLGFSNDDSHRVILNSSIMMAVGEIPNAMDIDAVTEASVASLKSKVQATFASPQYIDDPAGNYDTQTTGMKAVSAVEAENPVYLLNLGASLCTGNIPAGSTCTGSQSRGWLKVRVLRHAQGYKVQYAALNQTTHQELIITKDSEYHFRYVSFAEGKIRLVQPQKKKWDFVYTVLTNTTGEPPISYIFADMVLTNIKSNVGAYMVSVPAGQKLEDVYKNFTKESVDASKFDTSDQRAIGSKWRGIIPGTSAGASVFTDRFFVIRDTEGVYYKLKFLSMTNSDGDRGYPKFEYSSL